jgi:O-antigen ligase
VNLIARQVALSEWTKVADPRARSRVACLLAATLVAIDVWASAQGEWRAALLTVAAAATFYGAARSPETLLAVWFAVAPWAAYVLRFPAERSIVTFDRIAVVSVSVGLLARRRSRLPSLTSFEVAWALFAVVAVANALALSEEKGYALRIAGDAFALPLLLFYAVRTGFDVRRGRRALFWASVALALALPWVGIAELATGRDLLAYKGGAIYRAGIVRPNGPFGNDVSQAVVSGLVFVFLWRAPRALGLEIEGIARIAWRLAMCLAAVSALLPLFRTVTIALTAALALPLVLARRARTLARAALVALLLGLALTPLLPAAAESQVFHDRVADPSSVFSRLATFAADARVIQDHPLVGVGLANYRKYFEETYGESIDEETYAVAGVRPENTPHNALLGTWAELGLVGLACFLAAGVAQWAAAWNARDTFSLTLLLVYWVPGLTLQSNVYSDVNFSFLFFLALAHNCRVRAEEP